MSDDGAVCPEPAPGPDDGAVCPEPEPAPGPEPLAPAAGRAIVELLQARQAARASGDFDGADQMRDQLLTVPTLIVLTLIVLTLIALT
jgi:hypothetical protein